MRGKSFYKNGKLEGEYLYFNNKEILVEKEYIKTGHCRSKN